MNKRIYLQLGKARGALTALAVCATVLSSTVFAADSNQPGNSGQSELFVIGKIDAAAGLPITELVRQVELEFATKNPRGRSVPNVVFAPGTEGVKVPAALTLWNVSFPDALALIAGAAGCVVEPVLSIDPASGTRRMAGYELRNLSARNASETEGTTVTSAGRNPANSAAAGEKKEEDHDSVVRLYSVGRFLEPQNRTFELVMGVNEDEKKKIDEQKAAEREAVINRERALTDLIMLALNEGGIPGNEHLKMHFHEATKVLIVRAPQAVQEVVAQCIAALPDTKKPGL